jgi:pimeloyl-ACP methyl ester carboxylesterase
MPKITILNQELFYAVTRADQSAHTVVLVHGAGGTHLDWPAGLRRLPNADVYALDLPGHGKSAEPGRTTIEAYATDVSAFITTLDLQNVVLIGHSMGGAVVQATVLNDATRIDGLVLIGTGARLPVSELILNQTVDQFDAVVATIARYAWGRDADQAQVRLSAQRLQLAAPAVVHGDFVACNGFDVRDRLAEIDVPTLVISAENDQMMPPKFGRTLAEHIASATYVEIPATGHFMQLEQPETVTIAITNFLTN